MQRDGFGLLAIHSLFRAVNVPLHAGPVTRAKTLRLQHGERLADDGGGKVAEDVGERPAGEENPVPLVDQQHDIVGGFQQQAILGFAGPELSLGLGALAVLDGAEGDH